MNDQNLLHRHGLMIRPAALCTGWLFLPVTIVMLCDTFSCVVI